MSQRPKLQFALVGAGAISQAYAQAFETCEVASLVAVADSRAEAAGALAERLKARAFTSHEALLSEMSGSVHAAIVSTPPSTHPDIVEAFLARRIPVLCEKPMAIDVKSAQRMLDAADRYGTMLTMASKFRYVTDVIKAKSMVASGLIGDIVCFENAFTAKVDMGNRWNAKPELSGGGVLIDNGTHSLDIARYVLGPLESVQVVEAKRTQGLAVDETVHVHARSKSGVLASIDLSWSLNKELDTFIAIYGALGTIKIGWRQSSYKLASAREWTVFGTGYDKVQAFRSQIENVVHAIRGEEALLITAEDGLASVAAVEAAYQALRTDQWVRIG